MCNKTLTLKKKSLQTVELPTDYDRLLQSITLLAPVQKVSLDIDVTHKAALPAVIESALLLVAQLETVSPLELGGFFGLADHERQVLVDEMIDTGLVRYNDEGDIATTIRLTMQRREGAADEGIAIEDVENHRGFTFIDLCTGHIQPKCNADLQKGLPELARKINSSDFTDLIADQFRRFQVCLPDTKSMRALRSSKARLYRVNRASVGQSGLKQQISLDVHAHSDPLNGIRLEARLMDYSSEHTRLMESSGLKTEAINWLHERKLEAATTTLEDYCDLAKDTVIRRYIGRGGKLDLGRLLHDRQRRKTGYGDSATQRMIIGPVYAASNRDTLIKWAKWLPLNQRTHQGVWLGATNELFGASLGFGSFIKQMNTELGSGERNSRLNLAFQCDEEYRAQRLITNLFNSRTDGSLRIFQKGRSESHLEMLVFPGEQGMAVVQYHAALDPSLGYAGLTLPIGYFTTDPERVALLWAQVQQRIQSPLRSANQPEVVLDDLDQLLGCTSAELTQLLVDNSEEKLKKLVEKFNQH
ncbi:hypothetical protein DBV23_06295 [Edwardsiella ictaluri]|uniref:Uncharacterized protein n=1 Tax=Edwardsiella ictaluri (strain 93-146) TaxID=634503 RepID=C5BDJ2_EDWI9|nr:hypothetical protein [Edwardsiella ictaluri]ACR67608.1 hypothetical protein NT01EI_0366 [Edwardsiella ictaluri 93-146]AVZ81917.1 hypothetical protein DBV23_06295 [Edwardsiella ictaluri]EKS7762256.1 hypothetical protein [Edwardsiella ictaluri]EKS7769083.1 hypothetical protein [Edwardsiella ictaluri]EKS7772232.1 hypothetical protein [Edwardsiella ictaluri]